MDEFEPRGLLGDRSGDAGMPVPEARYRRASAGIDVTPAVRVDEENALPAGSDRRLRTR